MEGKAGFTLDAVDGRHLIMEHKVAQEGDLLPEVPVFAKIQRRIESDASFQRPAAEKDRMDGQRVFQLQCDRIKRLAKFAQYLALCILGAHSSIGCDGFRVRLKLTDQCGDMPRQQDIIVIQKTQQLAPRRQQARIGSDAAPQPGL